MKKIFVFVFICAGILQGCTKSNSAASVTITVRHEENGTWTALYEFSNPVKGISFRRQRNQFRVSQWVSDPAYKILSVGNQEEVVAIGGESFTSLSLRFQSFFSETPKDYEFFVPFSDGGVVMYSGHLDPVPMDCAVPVGCTSERLTERQDVHFSVKYVFVPAPGEKVILNGASSSGPVMWLADREGTYVYFGKQSLVDFGTYRAVLDPQLPPWIKQEAENEFPQVLQFYGEKTGFSLLFNPIVYLAYSSVNAGYGAKGGVLHQQVRLALSGSSWVSPTEVNREEIRLLIAHESAHFWNADLFVPNISDGDGWLHEGGADAFAYRALLALGKITSDRFMALEETALNQCTLGLGDISLSASDSVGRFRNVYDCGSTLAFLTESLLRQTNPKADLFTFWRDLFNHSADGTYTPQTYFEILKKNSLDADRSNLVPTLVASVLEMPDQFFLMAFMKAGAVVQENLQPPLWFDSQMGLYGIRKVVKEDCPAGGIQAHSYYDYIQVQGKKDCRNFSGNFNLDRVGGYSLLLDGSLAYDYIREQCGSRGSVYFYFFGSSQTIATPCSPVPQRPRYISFLR